MIQEKINKDIKLQLTLAKMKGEHCLAIDIPSICVNVEFVRIALTTTQIFLSLFDIIIKVW